MKKTFLIIAMALLGMTQAVAQEYEYVPFVREGVKWVYYYDNDFSQGVLNMPEEIQYYCFEMLSDVQIGDKYYKPVRLTHYLDRNGEDREVEDFVPVYLREENKVVYAIHPEGILYPQCPVGIDHYIGYPEQGLPLRTGTQEFILYDFNDPVAFYDSVFEYRNLISEDYIYNEYVMTDMVTIGNHQSKRHHFHTVFSERDYVIESIGYDGSAGMPLFYFEYFITGFQVNYYFSHVIEDGDIIYKGRYYIPDIHVGIDEVVTDNTSHPIDPHYYDLMGRAVGTEVPTEPGIYIHQGKKIVVR